MQFGRVLAGFVLVAALACSDDDGPTKPESVSITGTWVSEQQFSPPDATAGAPVRFTVFPSASPLDLEGRITLGTYSAAFTDAAIAGRDVSISAWNGNTFTLTLTLSADGDAMAGFATGIASPYRFDDAPITFARTGG